MASAALDLAKRLSPELCRLKVGKELFSSSGPVLVEQLQHLGYEVFLDLKFHDIPNTVAGAIRAVANLGVWMVNVHASGGKRMMAAAREAIEPLSHRPLLIAVTVLTSMTDQDLLELGYDESVSERVLRLAGLARESGLTPVGRAVPTDATIQGDDYFNPEGPLSAEWRRADSTWSLAPEDEIETMIETLTALRDAGELDAFVAEHDARRLHVGQTTFLAARRD